MALWKVNTILCGASSSGKTTLANDLIKRYSGFCFITEVARNLMKIQNISNADLNKSLHSDKKLFMDLQLSILKCQCLLERDMIDKIIISDRGPDSIVFGTHYVGEEFASELADSEFGKECLKRYHQFLVVLVNPLPTNNIDGVRMVLKTERDKMSFTEYFRTLFRKHGISYLDLTNSDRNERVKQLEQTIFKDGALLEFDCSQAVHIGKLSLPNLCQSYNTQSLAIPTLIISEDNIQQRMTTFYSGISRIMDRYGIANFLLVEFSPKMSAKLVHQILMKGILFGGEEFNFFGCSVSGLKKRKSYMWKGSIDDCNRILAESGDFESIKTVSKRIARISLLFSAVRLTCPIEDSQIVNIPDIERGGCNFTDGCGLIGCELAQKITDHVITESPKVIPSVFQIRLQGYKGVVVKDRRLPGDALHLRESMWKFNTTSYPVLGVVDYSQPYTFGRLNQQFIMLLSGLGIADEVFLTKQQEHFDRLTNMFRNRQDAFEVLLWRKEVALAQEALTCSDFASNSEIQSTLRKIRNKLLDQSDRLRLLVPQSRHVYGVCDTYGILEYGQCFCRPTIRGEAVTVRGLVIVCKNPCYLLGDVRVLRAVSSVDDPRISELEKDLVDCLVFPTDGRRPHADEIAGSDLDGDMFFVCWDQTLIPNSPRPAYGYPAAPSKRSIAITRESLIAYFASQNRTQQMVGKIDTFYKKWASMKGVNSVECESLGQLFSRAIDAAKSGEVINIPSHLQPPALGEDIQSKFVWELMQDVAAREKECMRENVVTSKAVNDVTIDFVWDLVTDPETCVKDFDIFEFICAWLPDDAERQHLLLEMCEYIDFGRFSFDQMEVAVARGVPRTIVVNALNKSHLMTTEMRQDFALHQSEYRWRFYWSGRHANFEWGILTKVLTTFKQSLIVLSLNDGVTFVIHFLQRCKLGKQLIKGNSVAVYFWSPHFGYRFRYMLNEGYSLKLEDGVFQLYRGELDKTFIWLKFECIGKSKPNRRSGSLVVDGTQFGRISVDITRFKSNILTGEQRHPLVKKSNLSALEIFVQDENKDKNFFDSLNVNDLICAAPDEEDAPQSSHEGDDYDEPFDDIPSEVTEEIFYDFLETSAECGNASFFLKALLQLGPEISLEVARDSLDLLEILLIRMLRKYHHHSLPPDVVSAVESLLGILGAAVKASAHARFLSFVELLSHPDLDHLASKLLQGRIDEISSQETLGVDIYSSPLNESQLTAIRSALSQPVTLVHGPPGTGKTHVGCEIIRQASEQNGHLKVLVIAKTNVAVDNIARKLSNESSTLRIVRVGSPGEIAPDLFDLSLDGQMENNAMSRGKITHYYRESGQMTRDSRLADEIMKSAEVVCTTCAGAVDFALSGVIFDFLLVDEAPQATEPSCLSALVRGCRQLVLIGDPQQHLPPCAQKTPPSDLRFPDISRTLFHRLSEAIEPVFLDIQHRMHPSLAEFPSRYFYGDKIKSGVSSKDRLPPEFPWPDRKRPLCIINASSTEARSGSSFKNVEEADLVCRVVEKLLFGGLSPMDIGVLTPYVGQVREIEHRLADRGFHHVMVKTIDGFQGREKEVIVFSTVRSNRCGKLGFAGDPKRVNVLLTRCKRGLIGVGNVGTLSSSEIWTAWIIQAPSSGMDDSL